MVQLVSTFHFFGNEYKVYDPDAARQADLLQILEGNLTQAERSKLEGIEPFAQVNKIEGVRVNFELLQPNESKYVNIIVPLSLGTGDNSAKQYGCSASGENSVAVGKNASAAGEAAFAEGTNNIAGGHNSHAAGSGSIARGNASHAEGVGTLAEGIGAHSEGIGTKALNNGETAVGQYNKHNVGQVFSVGIGSGDNTRVNAMEVFSSGQVNIPGLQGYVTPEQLETRIQALIGAAPAELDTLAELAAALQNNGVGAFTSELSLKANRTELTQLRNDMDAFHDCTIQEVQSMFDSIFND